LALPDFFGDDFGPSGFSVELSIWVVGNARKGFSFFRFFHQTPYLMDATYSSQGDPTLDISAPALNELSTARGKEQNIPFAINSSGSTFLPRLKLCRSRGSGFTPSYSMIQVDS
jgi:hypothetical protein